MPNISTSTRPQRHFRHKREAVENVGILIALHDAQMGRASWELCESKPSAGKSHSFRKMMRRPQSQRGVMDESTDEENGRRAHDVKAQALTTGAAGQGIMTRDLVPRISMQPQVSQQAGTCTARCESQRR